MRKISAFTMLELIVVMIIGAIIISLTLKTMNQIQQAWLTFYKQQTTYMSSLQFGSVFEKDWDAAVWVDKNSNVILLSTFSDTVSYEVLPEKVVRTSRNNPDTFNFTIRNVMLKSNGHTPEDITIDVSDQNNSDITWQLKRRMTSKDFCYNLADGN